MADDVATGIVRWLTTGKALIGVIVISFLAGGGVTDQLNAILGHEPRIIALESWRREHTSTETNPQIARIDQLESRQDTLFLRLQTIELLLSCAHYRIDPCPGAPPPPPRRD